MNQPTVQPTIGYSFWFWWLLGNFVGFLTFGALLPVTQWLAIRKHLPSISETVQTARWILVSTVGIVVGIVVGFTVGAFAVGLFVDYLDVSAVVIGWTVGWSVLGTMQWLLLRRWVSQASVWIVVNSIVGLAAGLAATIDLWLWFIAVFIVYPPITGLALTHLLKHPISKS